MNSSETLPSLFSFVIGLVAGSFFNVLIYRLPQEESIIRPGSHCPLCRHPIRWWENIPVISYSALRGRCSYCKTPISLMYPAVELTTGVAALFLWRFLIVPTTATMTTPWQIAIVVFESIILLSMIPLFIIDLKHYIIPDILTIPALTASIIASFFPGGLTPLECALGIAAGGGSLFGVGILGRIILKKEDAMGGGDVRLMALAGALWGWKIAIMSIFFASFIGSIAGMILILLRRIRKDRKIPFGPFLAAGLWAAVLTIDKLTAWYFHLLDRLFPG